MTSIHPSVPSIHPSGAAGSARSRRAWMLRRAAVPWAFLAVPLLLALVFKFIPLLEGIRLSFFKVQPLLGDQFVGLANYTRVLGDSRFQDALGHTLFLAVVQTAGAVLIGFLLALLLEGPSRVLQIARTAVFLPVVTAIAVIGEIWRTIYVPTDAGLLNSILGVVGIPPQPFLSDPSTALMWIAVVGIWTSAPYNMLIILAGLAGIDRSLYEAAAVDGATRWHRIKYIVVPGLRAALSVVLTLAALRSLRIFTEVFVLTGGGPAGSTEVWMTRVYSVGFAANDLGVASAASMLLLLVTIILTIGVRQLTTSKLAGA